METLFKNEELKQQQEFLFQIEKSKDVDSLKQIVAILSTQLQQQRNILNAVLKEKEIKSISLYQLGEKFLTYSKSNNTPNTYRRNRTLLKNLFSFFKDIDIANIKPEMIEKYKITRKQDVTPQGNIVSNATINRELTLLKTMLNKAKMWDLLQVNPFDKVKMFKENERPINFLTKLDIDKLLKSKLFRNKLYAHYEPMINIALYTGMRRGEIFNLQWKDVDFVNDIITIKTSKSHKVRHVPINEPLKIFLQKYKNTNSENDYIVTYKGRKIKSLHKGWRNFLRKSGVEKYYRFHDLRHTFASYLVMNNTDITTVQKLLGHSDVQTTMRYSHISDAHTSAAVEKLNF